MTTTGRLKLQPLSNSNPEAALLSLHQL